MTCPGAAERLPAPAGVFLSEVMSQQTPLSRVEPVWREWMQPVADAGRPGRGLTGRGGAGLGPARLPPPGAAAAPGGRAVVVRSHGGEVPTTEEQLRALPGVGAYTPPRCRASPSAPRSSSTPTSAGSWRARSRRGAAAPALTGPSATSRAPRCRDRDDAKPGTSPSMELGALVCAARGPRCDECPVADLCAWNSTGRPAYDGPARAGRPGTAPTVRCAGRSCRLPRGAHVGAARASWPTPATTRPR